MRTLIVVLNYRIPELTLQCLESVVPSLDPNKQRLVVVDNDSGDGSDQFLAKAIAERGWENVVQLKVLSENRGYAAGNNAGFVEGFKWEERPHYFMVLNPDAVANETTVSELERFLDSNPRVGLVGSRVGYEDGTLQSAAFRLPSLASEFETAMRLGVLTRLLSNKKIVIDTADEPIEAEWVSGASFMVRREVFEEVGFMDDRFFLYHEEMDFCRRARKRGWSAWYVPSSRVTHYTGASTGLNAGERPERRPLYWFESRRRYFQKNHGRLYASLADLVTMVGYGLWRLRRRLQGKPDRDPPHLLWDYFWQSSLFHAAPDLQHGGKYPDAQPIIKEEPFPVKSPSARS